VEEEEEPFPGMEADAEDTGAPEEMPIDDETPEDEAFLSGEEDEDIPGEELLPDEETLPDEAPFPDEAPLSDEEMFPDGEVFTDDAVSPDEESPFGEETPENFDDQDPAGEDEELLPEEPVEEPALEEALPETPASEETPVPEEAAEEPALPEESAEEAPPLEEPAEEASPDDALSPVSGEKAKDSLLGLMKFLKDLTGSLSDRDRDTFMQSDARLGMEYIIDTLEGRKGLIRDIEERLPAGKDRAAAAGDAADADASSPEPGAAGTLPPEERPPATVPAAPVQTPPVQAGGRMARLRAEAEERDRLNPRREKRKTDVAGMLAFLAKLAGALPDPHLGKAIGRKVEDVILGIRKTGKKGEDE
jgi:hypothetical protein